MKTKRSIFYVCAVTCALLTARADVATVSFELEDASHHVQSFPQVALVANGAEATPVVLRTVTERPYFEQKMRPQSVAAGAAVVDTEVKTDWAGDEFTLNPYGKDSVQVRFRHREWVKQTPSNERIASARLNAVEQVFDGVLSDGEHAVVPGYGIITCHIHTPNVATVGGSDKAADHAVEHVVQVVNKSKTSTAFLVIGDGSQRVVVSPGKEAATRVQDGTRVRVYSGETILEEETVKEPATFTVGS